MHNKKTINKNFWIPMIILIVSMIISVAIRQISVVIALFTFLFLSHPGIVFTREQLLDRIWGYDFAGNSRTVDTHVKTLRQKLGSEGQWIVTLIRSGYKFEVRL